MSVRAALPALWTALALAGCAVTADAGPWNPAPGEYASEIRGSLFASDDVHNADGDRVPLGGRFEERTVRWHNELGWRKHTAFLMTLPLNSVTVRDDDGTFSQNNTSLADLELAMRRQFVDGATAIAVELGWSAPLGYNRHLFPGVGSGLQALGLSVGFGTAVMNRGFFEASAGGVRRYLSLTNKGTEGAENWANEAALTADLGLWLGRSVLVGGRYDGRITVSHGDLYEELTQHLVGPVALYRVDERVDVKAGSWHTALGENVLHVNQYYVAVVFKNTRLNRLQGFLGGTATGR